MMTREEAIEVYNGLINAKIREAFEFFVPELRESEDERIRKAIIEFIKQGSINGSLRSCLGISEEQMIAYLEKQKEQKPVEQNYDNRIQYDSIKSGIEAFASTYSFNTESKLFSQLTKEQQQLWREEIEQAAIAGGEYGIELSRDNRYKENRTIEWSEEDETKLRDVVRMIEDSGHVKSIREHYEKFLTSLPERFNLQPKQEWSEEDKKLIDDVINSLCCYQNNLSDYQKEIVGEEIRKLKSLKPQPKQEWSDDDKKMIERIVGSLYSLKCYVQDNVSYSEIIKDDVFKRIEREQNWLKSLPFNFKKKLD